MSNLPELFGSGTVVPFPTDRQVQPRESRSLRKACPVCKSPAGERCVPGNRSLDDSGTHHERVAAAVADAWWDDVKARTGHPPVQSYQSLIGQRGIVTRMLRADWDGWSVLRAMCELHTEGRPVTLTTLEARLNGAEQARRQQQQFLHPTDAALLRVMQSNRA